MAYSTSNPPSLLLSQAGGTFKQWFYSSSDAASVVDASSYISDGQAHGMALGDQVIVREAVSTTRKLTSHVVVSLSTATDGVDLSNGVSIGTSTSDSD